MKYALTFALAIAAACNSSSSSSPDAPGMTGSNTGSGSGSDPGTGSGSGAITLTIENYLSWCTVTENGGPLVGAMTFPAGTVVHLGAVPESSLFIWGYWVGTDGDTGSAHDTNMMTTVTMTASKTVQACCPDAPPSPLAPCPPPT
jgi:hypothetical protein